MEPGFTSLCVTIGALRRRSDWLARLLTIALTAGLGILAIHLAFYPWPDITKEPVQYAGLTARDARDKAVMSLGTMSIVSPLLSLGSVLAFVLAVAGGERPRSLAVVGATPRACV
jgi:hypothetical protein